MAGVGKQVYPQALPGPPPSQRMSAQDSGVAEHRGITGKRGTAKGGWSVVWNAQAGQWTWRTRRSGRRFDGEAEI